MYGTLFDYYLIIIIKLCDMSNYEIIIIKSEWVGEVSTNR